MRTSAALIIRYALPIALAVAFAIVLTACGEKPSSESAIDRLAQNAGRNPVPAPAAAAQKSAQAYQATGDQALAARVKAAIAADPALQSLTVDVNAADGVITLFGTADTPANSHQAAMLALNVEGVRSVRNKIVIVRGS
ncbi:MAG TPA: BON domain-containing protein [Burkholderiales bacterium]|nr:BON domain-containing protein [Burkholderiales bacterium]